MPGVRELPSTEGFSRLSQAAQQIIFQQAAANDADYQALSPEARDIVRTQILAGQAPVARPSYGSYGGMPPAMQQPAFGQGIAEGVRQAIGLSPQEQPSIGAETQEEVRRGVLDALKTTAATGISTAAGAGAGILSTLTGPAAPFVLPPLEMASQYGARKANVALGLEAPGTTGDILSVAVPGAVRVGGAVGKQVLKRLPGAAAAMHEEGAALARGLPAGMVPDPSAETLYQQAYQSSPLIPTTELGNAAVVLLDELQGMSPGLRKTDLMRVMRGLIKTANENPGGIPLQNFHDNMKEIGALKGASEAAGGKTLGAYKQLYAAAYRDLEDAAAQPGIAGDAADALIRANKAARKEFAADDLKNLIESKITPVQGATQQEATSGKMMLKQFREKIRKDELFAGSFTPEELDHIETTLEQLTTIPRMPPERGAAFGSGALVGRGTVASGASLLLGADPTTATAMGLLATGAPWLISRALVTQPGRDLLHVLMQQGPLVKPEALTALATFARVTGDLAAGEKPPKSYVPLPTVLKDENLSLEEKIRAAQEQQQESTAAQIPVEEIPIEQRIGQSQQLLPQRVRY